MPITPLDLTAERFEIGDTDEVVTKQNSTATKFEKLAREVIEDNAALRSDSAALRSDSETLFNQVRSENASVFSELRDQNEASLNVNLTDTLSSQLNLAPDHGTFIRQSNHPDDLNGFAIDGELTHESLEDIVQSFNGCDITRPVEASRHNYNSTTFGGTRGADDATALKFLAAMSRDSKDINGRYLPEFAVVEYTAGLTGAGTNYDDCYGWHQTNRLAHISSAHGEVSFSYYFQAIDADAWVFGYAKTSPSKLYVDGVEILNTGNTDGEWLKLNKGQVYHVAGSISMTDNQFIFSAITRTHVKLGTKFRVALPWASSGAFQMMPHSRPVRSYGTVGQSPLVDRRIRGGVDEVLTDVQNQAAAVLTDVQNDVAQVIQSAENQVDASTAELGLAADSLLLYQNSQPNLLPNNGSFLGSANEIGIHTDSSQRVVSDDLIGYFAPANGTSAPIDFGRFYYNSSTNGGTELENTVWAEIVSRGMGLSAGSLEARFTSGFGVALLTQGNGTAGLINGKSIAMHTFPLSFLSPMQTSASIYYVSADNDSYFYGVGGFSFINGVPVEELEPVAGENYFLLEKQKVYHLASISQNLGVDFNMLRIFGDVGNRHLIACPRVAAGAFQLSPHRGPVRSV